MSIFNCWLVHKWGKWIHTGYVIYRDDEGTVRGKGWMYRRECQCCGITEKKEV